MLLRNKHDVVRDARVWTLYVSNGTRPRILIRIKIRIHNPSFVDIEHRKEVLSQEEINTNKENSSIRAQIHLAKLSICIVNEPILAEWFGINRIAYCIRIPRPQGCVVFVVEPVRVHKDIGFNWRDTLNKAAMRIRTDLLVVEVLGVDIVPSVDMAESLSR
jgi:hypothetical protein